MTSTFLRLIFSSHQFIKIRKDFLLNTCKYQVIFIYLQQKIFSNMGTITTALATKIARKQAHQEKKKQEDLLRIARYLSAEEREILFSGDGFVRVPKEEARRMRIDAYLHT